MRRMNKDVKGILVKLAAACVVAAVLFVCLLVYCNYLSGIDRSVELGTDGDDYRFTYDTSKEWSEEAHGYLWGEQIDLAVENHTSQPMQDWSIVLHMVDGCAIDSSWNGEFNYDTEADIITITCLDFNGSVDAGETQPFGMVLYTNLSSPILSGKFLYHEEKKVTDLTAFWVLLIVLGVVLVSGIDGIYFTLKQEKLKKKQKASLRIISQSLVTFANTIDAKDSYTKGHSQRVAFYSRELARRMGMDEEFCQNILYVGLLHDIGKIGVQDAILKKSAKLTYDEFNEIKEHVSMGGDILKDFTAIPGIEDGARYHHEKYDGTGYMKGLKGEEIPLIARIITVADSFDAMSSARCYRNAMTMDAIIAELDRCTGTQFDPKIVPYMIQMIDEGIAPITLRDGQFEEELEL